MSGLCRQHHSLNDVHDGESDYRKVQQARHPLTDESGDNAPGQYVRSRQLESFCYCSHPCSPLSGWVITLFRLV